MCDVHSCEKNEKAIPMVPLNIENNDSMMPLDTGCALSLAPKAFYDRYISHLKLETTRVVLSTYTSENVHPIGQCVVNIRYNGKLFDLPLLITNEGSTPLFGRNWLAKIKLDWLNIPGIQYIKPIQGIPSVPVSTDTSLENVLEKHAALFIDGLGCYTGAPVELSVTSQPRLCKARPVPYAMQSKGDCITQDGERRRYY